MSKLFQEQFLDHLFALPTFILNNKNLMTEFRGVGSFAREELVPFSDLEMFVLFDTPQNTGAAGNVSEICRDSLKATVDYLYLLAVGLGETNLVSHEMTSTIKLFDGFSLDKLHLNDLHPLVDETNQNTRSLLTPVDALLNKHKNEQAWKEESKSLFAYLKSKRIFKTEGACFHYQEELKTILNQSTPSSQRLHRERVALSMIETLHVA